MRPEKTAPLPHPSLLQVDTEKRVPYLLIKPYLLKKLVYTTIAPNHGFIFTTPPTRTTDLLLPAGTELQIQKTRDFPGKVWLVGKVYINTSHGVVTEPLARLIPESDLHHFVPKNQDHSTPTHPETSRISTQTAKSVGNIGKL